MIIIPSICYHSGDGRISNGTSTEKTTRYTIDEDYNKARAQEDKSKGNIPTNFDSKCLQRYFMRLIIHEKIMHTCFDFALIYNTFIFLVASFMNDNQTKIILCLFGVAFLFGVIYLLYLPKQVTTNS